MDAERFQSLVDQSYSNFQLRKTDKPLIHEIKQGSYLVGHLININNLENPVIYYFNGNADLFLNLNAFGILKEVLTDGELPYTKMVFFCKGIKYETTRKHFKKNCIEKKWDFGTKCYLPINLFKASDNLDQPDLFEGSSDEK